VEIWDSKIKVWHFPGFSKISKHSEVTQLRSLCLESPLEVLRRVSTSYPQCPKVVNFEGIYQPVSYETYCFGRLRMLYIINTGLFSKAIMQSGVATSNWSVFKEPARQAKRFAEKFGCSTANTKEMVKCMKSIETKELVKGHEEILVRYTKFENGLSSVCMCLLTYFVSLATCCSYL
jgi:hypothetical protein